MNRATALRYAAEVARRLHSVNGLLATPNCRFEAVRVRRVWVFGSTVKGKAFPNDLDLLIEAHEVGRVTRWCKGRKLNKEYARRYGRRHSEMPSATHEFCVWLTKGMRKVSRHVVGHEELEPDVKRLIYPRWDLI